MHVDLSAKGVELGAGLRRGVERRLSFALGRFAAKITRVAVHLSVLDHGRGSQSARCRVTLSGPGLRDLVAEESAPELSVAVVDRAVRRVARRLTRELDRRKNLRCRDFDAEAAERRCDCVCSARWR